MWFSSTGFWETIGLAAGLGGPESNGFDIFTIKLAINWEQIRHFYINAYEKGGGVNGLDWNHHLGQLWETSLMLGLWFLINSYYELMNYY